ncbi:MAG: hypothetical protein J1F33_06425 [Clostridiales bacterium]|nr:hypothetical protein [Clostridiales bacterium]
MKCAVIDMSSTGVSTVVAECDDGKITEILYKDRTNISVIEYLEGRNLSRRGIEKLIDALIAARAASKALGAETLYVISTAALRHIDNLEVVAENIRTRTGMVINHLDGKTEAYCDHMSNRKYSVYERAVMIDIGGGSVEIGDLSSDKRSDMICLDFGPLKLRNKYVADIYPTVDEAKKIKKFLRKKCDEVLPKKCAFNTAVLVGSINDAIYAVYKEYCDKKKTDTTFTYGRYKKFVEMLLTSDERTRLIMKAAPEKINVLPVSAIILKELLKRFKLDNIVISDAGVKEGFLALVLAGVENGVAVDLASPVPLYAQTEPEPVKKKAGKSSGQKKQADKKSAGKETKKATKKETKKS